MISRWKWVHWLNLLSEINRGGGNKGRSSGSSPGSVSSKLSPNKPIIVKVLAALSIISVLFFIYWKSWPTEIDIKSIGCEGGDLQITSSSNNSTELKYKLDKNKLDSRHVYSESLSIQDSQYKIYIHSDKGWITFKVTRDKSLVVVSTNTGSPNQTPLYHHYYLGKDCSILHNKNKTPGSGDCGCGNGTGGTNCGNCCNGTGGASGTCTCSTTGGTGCACCEIVKWIDFAINNQQILDVIRPKAIFVSLIPSLIYLFLLFWGYRYFSRNVGGFSFGGGSSLFGGLVDKTVKSNVSFRDVAGIDEVKRELEEVVDYLKRPSRYHAMGAKGPKGIVLYGPPGTGKTLLAKAVSGEADVPFIETSGSSFDDMFVGAGAKRVRELFAKARKLSPCIIFIDEIDSVAGKRGNKYIGGGGGLADQTINQLLSEMDGFNTNNGIVIIAATNRLESLDEAILRPGRFDRLIQVNLPNILGRRKILEIHARNKNLSSSVDLEEIARKTHGFSGAQLAGLLNEATLMAVRDNKRVIVNEYIDEAIDRVIAGIAKKDNTISFNEKKQISYHEAGHAIVGLYVKGGDIVEKVTIIPRGNAAGFMLSFPEKIDPVMQTKEELLAIATTTLAGRAAEEIFFGEDKVGTGAANDLFKVTALVRAMVTKFGMSKNIGLIQYEPTEGMENPYRKNYSDKSSENIDEEIKEIITRQYELAKEIILDNKEEFLLIAEALMLLETLDRKQIDYIHTNKELPKEAREIKDGLNISNQLLLT